MPSGGARRGAAPAPLATICLGLACLVGLLAAAPALGAAPRLTKPAKVAIGKVRLARAADGRSALLVPIRYPIQLNGHRVRLRASLLGGGPAASWEPIVRLSAGPLRLPERRRSFTFVQRLTLSPAQARRVRQGARVKVMASGLLDANRDGVPELRSNDRGARAVTRAAGTFCGSMPRLQALPGRRIRADLPACGATIRWRIRRGPGHGVARIRHGRLVYRPAARFRGTDTLKLVGRRRGASTSAELIVAPVQVAVTNAGGVVVRALGDSVTAGFGYYDNGQLMPLASLYECRPGVKPYNDACSSNSTNTSAAGGKLAFAPDYGLANNVSWAAQWATEHAITNYENLAVSGSEPSDWAPGGDLHPLTERLESEHPDYILMTMGANPLLSEMLFGIDNMGCAIYADVLGGYAECVERAFSEVHLRANLKSLYADLVQHTEATIFLMQYHLSVPSSALLYSASQIAEMGKLLNREIASVAGEVSAARLKVIAPPHFNVGVDISPVYPSNYSCSRFGFEVDGPSVQSTPTQDELAILHPLSFCEGPVPKGPPWVISGDTGIHPSAAGYAQMASRLPAPSGS